MVYSVFGFAVVLSFLLFFNFSPDRLILEPWIDPLSILTFIAAVGILVLGAIPLFNMQTIRIDTVYITFQKQVCSSHIKQQSIKNYDYYRTIHESSENGEFEAVWLIKDGKLVKSFSSFQYANYNDLKKHLNLEYKGHLHLSPIKQLLCKLGAKI